MLCSTSVLLFIVILNVCLGLFRFPFLSVSPFEAVPHSTAFIFASNQYAEFLAEANDQGISNLFGLVEKAQKDHQALITLLGDSIATNMDWNALATLQKVSATEVDFLYVFDTQKAKVDFTLLQDKLATFKSKTYHYLGHRYQSVKLSEEERLVVFKFRNLLLISRYPVLIEDGIRQLQNYRENLTLRKGFKEIAHNDLEKASTQLYIHAERLSDFFNNYLTQDYRKLLKSLPHFFSWIAIDIDGANQPSLSGRYTKSYQNIKKVSKKTLRNSALLRTIPDNTGMMYLEQGVDFVSTKDSIYQTITEPWINKEWALAVINPQTSIDQLLILGSKGKEYAQHYLERYGKSTGELIHTSYQTFPLVQLLDDRFLDPFCKQLMLDFSNPFYTIIEDQVLFSTSRQSLEMVIDKYIVGQDIFKNETFLKYLNTTPDHPAAMFYVDGKAVHHLLQKIVGGNVRMATQKVSGGITFSFGKGCKPLQLDIINRKIDEKRTSVAWRAALPAKVRTAPKPIWNEALQVYEILIQDESHRLYLLNNVGEILWKRTLTGPILSEIQEIDYHEDGQSKLLFNTANNIYLIDKSGKNIGNYPLKLQSPATNGICVVDFQQNKKYQYFLACKNGHAYGFTKEGNPVYGWNPKSNIGYTTHDFQHFQYQGKDHLMILTEAGKLATFNSEGRPLMQKMSLGKLAAQSPAILDRGKRKVIALLDEYGQLNIINNKGDSYRIPFEKQKKSNLKLTFANLIGDRDKDFVTLSKNKVTCYYQDKRQLKQHFEIELKDNQDEVFAVEVMGNEDYAYFGTLSHSRKEINLFNAQQALHPDFPLAGTTTFAMLDLYQNNQYVLIAGYDKAVYAYHIAKDHPISE